MTYRSRKIKTKNIKLKKEENKALKRKLRYFDRKNIYDSLFESIKYEIPLRFSNFFLFFHKKQESRIFFRTFLKSFFISLLKTGPFCKLKESSIPIKEILMLYTVIFIVHFAVLNDFIFLLKSHLLVNEQDLAICKVKDTSYLFLFCSFRTLQEALTGIHVIIDFFSDKKKIKFSKFVYCVGIVFGNRLQIYSFSSIFYLLQTIFYKFLPNELKVLFSLQQNMISEIDQFDFFSKLFEQQNVGRDKKVFKHVYFRNVSKKLIYNPVLTKPKEYGDIFVKTINVIFISLPLIFFF